jgi:hypothetical protein
MYWALETSIISNIYYSNLSKDVRKKRSYSKKRKEKKRKKNYMGFYVVAHQPTPRRLLAAQRRRSIFLAVPLRLGPPSAQIFCSFIYSRSVALRLGPRVGSSARRRRPATEGQSQARRRRRRLPLPPLASRLAPSPPSSAHRPATLRTHLPLPSRLCCTVGARPLAPPVIRRISTLGMGLFFPPRRIG